MILFGNVSTKTGDSPYEINATEDLSTGKGYYSAGVGASTRKYIDPVVLFASVSANYGFKESGLNQKRGSRIIDEFEPGISGGFAFGFAYSFNYDVFYNLVSTKIGNVAITSNTYDSNGNLAKTTYANGDYFEYTYDDYGNISVITGETGKIAEMIYNKQGLVTKAVDYSSGETSYYYYTFDGSLESEYRTSSDGSLTHYIVTDSERQYS